MQRHYCSTLTPMLRANVRGMNYPLWSIVLLNASNIS
jgi:hypothetical protein